MTVVARLLPVALACFSLVACQSTGMRKDAPEARADVANLAADAPGEECGGAELSVHYINVGQAGSTLIVGPNGTSVLYDFGEHNADGQAIATYLTGLELTAVDYAILSHRHKDHYGGYDSMLAEGIDVTTANLDSRSKTPESGLVLTDWWQKAATTTAGKPHGIKSGGSIDLGCGASIFVAATNGVLFNNTKVPSHNENDKSVSLLIRYGDFSMTLDGDIGSGPEYCTDRRTDQVGMQQAIMSALIAGGHVDAEFGVDVIHMAHHGSHSSTGPAYFNLAKPEVAIASVGLDGGNAGYGHPRASVVEETLLGPHRPSCVKAPPVEACFQTEDGLTNANIHPQQLASNACLALGDITITVDSSGDYDISGNNRVAAGSDKEADGIYSFTQDQAQFSSDAATVAFRPFFDDIDNPVQVNGKSIDMTPESPELTAFDKRLLTICGPFGAPINDLEGQLAEAFVDFPDEFDAIAERIRAEGISLGDDDTEFAAVLIDDWTRAAGFEHVFCGEVVSKTKLGGLHWVGRYVDLQHRNQGGLGAGGMETDGSEIFTIPVEASCPKWSCSDAMKGYALNWSATEIFAEGIIAAHFGIQGANGACQYKTDAGLSALFAWKNGAIRTFYPDATPSGRKCRPEESPLFMDSEGPSALIESQDVDLECGE